MNVAAANRRQHGNRWPSKPFVCTDESLDRPPIADNGPLFA
jgi:hypothetical protein